MTTSGAVSQLRPLAVAPGFLVLSLLGGCADNASAPAPAPDIVAIQAGFLRSCALDGDGQAWCWGMALRTAPVGDSACGPGEFGCNAAPVKVQAPEPLRQLRLARGIFGDYACGLSETDRGYCWGYLLTGLDMGLSIGDSPTRIDAGLTLSALSAYNSHICGITSDSLAYCWGDF